MLIIKIDKEEKLKKMFELSLQDEIIIREEGVVKDILLLNDKQRKIISERVFNIVKNYE